jgi:hypothetical protein
MALARTARGTATSTTSGTNNLTRVPTGDFAANSLAVLAVAYDNSGSSGADPFGTGSVTDTAGNTWTSRHATLRDPSTASSGCVLRIFTTSMNAATLTTGHTITFTTQSNVTAKVCSLHEITAAASYKATYLSTGTGAGGASTAPSVTTGTISVDDLTFGAVANEYGTAQTLSTPDADATNGSWDTNTYVEIGTTTSGMNLTVQAKLQTTANSTQTYNLTMATSTDWAAGWISVDEVSTLTTYEFTDKKADAVVKATMTPTGFTANAVVLVPSFLADAVVEGWGDYSATWSNNWATAAVEGHFHPDAVIKKTITPTFTANAIVKATPTGSFTANAIPRLPRSGSFTADAVVKKTGIAGSFTANSIPRLPRSGSFTANAIPRLGRSSSATADGLVKRNQTGSFTANAVLKQTPTGTPTANAVIFKAGIAGSLTANSTLLRPADSSFTANADIKSTQSGSATADSIRLRTFWFGRVEDGF